MSSTHITVGDRTFYVKVSALRNSSEYTCSFHERWFGKRLFVAGNKNSATKELDEVIDRLTNEFDNVEEL